MKLTCNKCNNFAILENAGIVNSIPFWYCKNCKIEVFEIINENASSIDFVIEELDLPLFFDDSKL